MGSTRLPGKVMLPLAGKPLIIRMQERLSLSRYAGKIIIATTDDESDDQLFRLCKQNNLNIFRGHSLDLLDRHYRAAKKFNADVVIKIPSDCPLIDPEIIDKVIQYYISNRDKFDFVSNLHPPTYPDGNDVEIMSIKVLEDAWINAKKDFEREHTTPYIWENPDKFRIGNVVWETGLDYSMTHRFTIDYNEDYEFIKRIYDELYEDNKRFRLKDILALLEKKPEIKKINEMYTGVNWYRNHLDELKTISAMQTKKI
ncbi:MAG: glycosyltransferase family protein [Ignavibacteriaceae bacterium]|jgi:spore coat polysaccharide biosynthesis protein SpsF|nr:glycosyltransferase family protein [Ignavibacteriaceae bacterium]MCU0412863.1 glycosyltransferase family protein [Ignavibacteriaceae bacterium]